MVSLRDLVADDLDLVLMWRNSPIVNEYLSNRLKTKPEITAWFERLRENPKTWLKLILANDVSVGYAAIESIDEKNRKCELAVVVGVPGLWGTGVGRAVLHEMLQHAFKVLKMHRVFVAVCRGNLRSEKLVGGMNFRHEGTMRESLVINGEFVDLLCYSLLESEYKEDK